MAPDIQMRLLWLYAEGRCPTQTFASGVGVLRMLDVGRTVEGGFNVTPRPSAGLLPNGTPHRSAVVGVDQDCIRVSLTCQTQSERNFRAATCQPDSSPYGYKRSSRLAVTRVAIGRGGLTTVGRAFRNEPTDLCRVHAAPWQRGELHGRLNSRKFCYRDSYALYARVVMVPTSGEKRSAARQTGLSTILLLRWWLPVSRLKPASLARPARPLIFTACLPQALSWTARQSKLSPIYKSVFSLQVKRL